VVTPMDVEYIEDAELEANKCSAQWALPVEPSLSFSVTELCAFQLSIDPFDTNNLPQLCL
jgi:hypothetical protein